MNPWMIIGVLAMLAGSWFGGHHQGYKVGVNEQKVADQKTIDAANARTQGIIDGYNIQIVEQKADANLKYRKAQADVIEALAERDTFKTKLGEEHVKNQDLTNRLRDAYAAYGLRFAVPAEDARHWCGGGGAEAAGLKTSGDAPPAVIQLPEALARNLRQFAYDADELNDDYKLCYGYEKVDSRAFE
jgi:hypothetical protein